MTSKRDVEPLPTEKYGRISVVTRASNLQKVRFFKTVSDGVVNGVEHPHENGAGAKTTQRKYKFQALTFSWVPGTCSWCERRTVFSFCSLPWRAQIRKIRHTQNDYRNPSQNPRLLDELLLDQLVQNHYLTHSTGRYEKPLLVIPCCASYII